MSNSMTKNRVLCAGSSREKSAMFRAVWNAMDGAKKLGVVRFGLLGRAVEAHRSCENSLVALRFEPLRPVMRYPIATDTTEVKGAVFDNRLIINTLCLSAILAFFERGENCF